MFRFHVLLLTVWLAPFAALGQVAPYAPIVSVDPFGWDNTVKVLSKFDAWTATGDFPLYSAESTAAPTPSLDCVSSTWTGSGNWACTGGTGTIAGNPTQSATPYYPDGFSGSARQGVLFDGTGDYFKFGDIYQPTTAFTTCVVFRPTNVDAGTRMLISKDGATRGWSMNQIAAGLYFQVFSGASANTAVTISTTLSAKAWYSACASYSFDGVNSVVDASLNGSNVTAVNDTKGPVQTNTVEQVIGYWGNLVSYGYVGTIARAIVWPTWAASSTQLQALSNSLMGLYPNGKQITFSRSTISMCRPGFGAQEFHYLGANMPCWTSKGLRVWKGANQYVPVSLPEDISAWTDSGTPTIGSNTETAPDGTATADTISSVGGVLTTGKYRGVTTSATKYGTFSAFLKAPTGDGTAVGAIQYATTTEPFTSCTATVISGTATLRSCYTDGCAGSRNCTCAFDVDETWSRVAVTGITTNTATAFYYGFSGGEYCLTGGVRDAVAAWGFHGELGKIPSPYYPTGGAAWGAETASFANPLASSAVQPVTISTQIAYYRWAQGDTSDFSSPISYGAYASNNTFTVRIRGDGSSALYVRNNAGSARTADASSVASLTALEPYWFSGSYTGDSYPKYWSVNAFATSWSSSGDAIMSSQPTTIYIGNGSNYQTSGYVAKARVCKGTTTKACAK